MASKRKPQAIVRRRARRKPQAIVKVEKPTVSQVIEQVLIQGDLTSLSTEQRLEYYKAVCQSLGLNPLTRPFDYIAFKATETSPAKLVLYARKDCTEQLRKLHGIAITESSGVREEGIYIVTVKAQDRHGRTDTGTGAVDLTGLKGKNRANAIMICETKAKRRATLSMAGLGFLDESEIEGIGDYGTLTPGGRIMTVTPQLTEAEKNWQLREAEGISKLTSAQREIVERKIEEAATKVIAIIFYPDKEDGDVELRTDTATAALAGFKRSHPTKPGVWLIKYSTITKFHDMCRDKGITVNEAIEGEQ